MLFVEMVLLEEAEVGVAIPALPSSVAFSTDIVSSKSSPSAIASSNVVNSLSSVCAYIELPLQAFRYNDQSL